MTLKRVQSSTILIILPFLLTWTVILVSTKIHNGDLSNIKHLPDFTASLFIALLVSFISLKLFGDTQQRKDASKIIKLLVMLAVAAYIVFAAWLVIATKNGAFTF